ncbi:hypothetical protein AR687_03515 [Flavobacteriaceae bacterium CRH]|nr:hypothetical protein AR687_03515 [Flavobacteriaceae bacterium CRH]
MGWKWDNIPYLINQSELDWFITKIPPINKNEKESLKDEIWNYNCFSDLVLFLNFVKENEMELRISYE